jgi:hypothetical protein
VDLSEIILGVDWIYVAQGRDRWRNVVNAVMKLMFSQGSIVFLRRALLQIIRWLVGGLLKSRAGYRLHWLMSRVVCFSPSIETFILVSLGSYFY